MVLCIPITCKHAIVSASLWVGLTFPGIIEEPGSFSGRLSSPSPERGPDASNLISLAILNRSVAKTFNAPDNSNMASCAANA